MTLHLATISPGDVSSIILPETTCILEGTPPLLPLTPEVSDAQVCKVLQGAHLLQPVGVGVKHVQ